MLLADLVAAAQAVSSTASRTAKLDALATVFRTLADDEISPAAGFLSGDVRQGKIGVGWATLAALNVEPATTATLTISDFDSAIDRIRETTGPGSASARGEILRDLLARATHDENDYIRRILTGELRQGALEGIATDAIARASGQPLELVRRALMLSGNLGETARRALRDGKEGLAAVGLQVLRPIKPMLASTADDVAGALAATGLASVEWKLDGIRIQVHRRENEVRIYTRNLNDVTERVPEVVEVARSLDAHSFVLDGEAIAVDPRERPQAFQDILSRFGTRSGHHELPLVPFFFDALHVDGRDLIDLGLTERLARLDDIASVWRIPAIITADPVEAKQFLDRAIEAGHEGVMVKGTTSLYQAGRRGKAWRKVKPVTTFDLVILGAEWGHGRRHGWLSNLHLGARDSSGGFLMVGKTFKGLTDEMLTWQTKRLLEMETSRSGITVFVRPELVVEIALDGVHTSTRYPGGIALRFARVKRYREDKPAGEADTIDSLRNLLGRA
ncbi:MAG: ATP-dependent DNA ligase [Actinobacteria bacterium]|nr:ATP-dependent DNA ligase [Actinomycetota bacterium]